MISNRHTNRRRSPARRSLRWPARLRRQFRIRGRLGSFFVSDSAERYWRVHVHVSRRKGRYLNLEHQGTPGLLRVDDFRATADDYVTSPSRPPYQRISPVEWAKFAALASHFNGRAADEQAPDLAHARAALDRIVGDQFRSAPSPVHPARS